MRSVPTNIFRRLTRDAKPVTMGRAAWREYRPVAAWSVAGWLVLLPQAAAAAGAWTITPQISDQENYTDNVLLTPTNRRSDFITTLSPSLTISGASARLRGTLNYSPTAYLYALTPSQDALAQNLYADGTATLVPRLFFLDAHAYASRQPTLPGLATGGAAVLPSLAGGAGIAPGVPSLNPGIVGTLPSSTIPTAQLTQVTGFDASPYLVRRFDGFGTGELRYTVSDTNTSGGQNSPLTPPGFAALTNSSQLTNEGTAAFQTGEDFGPFSSRVVLDTAQSSGTGTLQASQTIGVADSAYALTQRVFALASLGYEHLRFGGLPPTRIDDAVWGIGARLTPRRDARITALYGHRNGVTAPYLSIQYPVTARTTLTASYSEGLSTTSQDIADALAVSAANQAGQTVDARTLLPAEIVNPVLGLQSGLFRTTQFTGTASLHLERNQVSLSVYRISNALVAQNAPGSGTSEQTTGGNAVWQRDISPLTTASLGVGYEQIGFPTPVDPQQNLLSANLSVQYLFTRTVTGWAGYSLLRRASPSPQFHLLENVVFVGLSKAF